MKQSVGCIVVCLLSLPLLAAPAPQVDRLVPAEAELAVVARDLPGLKARWLSSPFAALWNDEAMRAFFAPFHRQLAEEAWNEQLTEETGYTFDELVALFPGGIAAYVPDVTELIEFFSSEKAGDAADLPIVVIADAGDRIEDLEALVLQLEEREAEKADAESSYVDTVRQYRDVAVHIEQRVDLEDPKDETSWAVVDQVMVFAGTPELVHGVVDDVLDGLETEPLALSADAGVAEHVADRDLYAYVDLRPMVPIIERQIAEALAENNPMGLDVGVVMRALRLDAARAGFLSFGLDGSTARVRAGTTTTSDVGVFKVLALENKPLRKVEGLPARAVSFSVSHFDFRKAWQALEDIFNAVNPMYLAMVGGQLKGWQEAKGVQLDLEGGLLDNIQSEVVAVQLEPEGDVETLGGMTGQDQLTILSIADRPALERLIDAVRSGVSEGSEMFEKREFLGTTIWTIKQASPNAATPRMAYAVTDGHLYISVGDGRALEAVLMARSRENAPSAWDQPAVKRAIQAVSGPVASFAYQQTDVWMETVFSMMAMACTTDDEGQYTICHPDKAPTAEVFRQYLGPLVTTMTKSQQGMVADIWILLAEGGVS